MDRAFRYERSITVRASTVSMRTILSNILRKARAEHRLDWCMRVYMAPKALLIDEFGVWTYDRLGATALSSLISACDERGEVLGDTVVAAAVY
jgi:hypothetical protein